MLTYDEYVSKHFPQIDDGVTVCGNKILVQLRTVPKASAGGIVLVEDTRSFNAGNTKVAIVRKMGHIAYRSRESGEPWREGMWAAVGDIVVTPAYGGFRFEVPVPGTDDNAIFAIFNDFDIQLVVNSSFETFDKLL
jgi:co-chaperonin GroES (HSP10)